MNPSSKEIAPPNQAFDAPFNKLHHYGYDNYIDFMDWTMPLASKKFSDLSESEKKEAIEALKCGDCEYKGIKLYGKVQFVTSFADIKIQYVESFPDIKVQYVTSFPNKCGQWQKVTSFPDFKVQMVSSFPDLKVKVVTSFPGM
ncbi:MAG: hypothetical protein JJT94_08695 [Bernardetiaceae bacterium]|nr:hypothetical protein [Bernardetiaceae bacterium]